MTEAVVLKRQNFNVTAEEEAQLLSLRDALGAASVKDAILRTTRVMLSLSHQLQLGNRLYATDPKGVNSRILLPDLEAITPGWKFLTPRPHSWKRQLYIKGRRVTAANVWFDMRANSHSRAQAADNWDLSVEAIDEICHYCEANRELLRMESDEEKLILNSVIPPYGAPAKL